jgi:hypothetical protein
MLEENSNILGKIPSYYSHSFAVWAEIVRYIDELDNSWLNQDEKYALVQLALDNSAELSMIYENMNNSPEDFVEFSKTLLAAKN